MDKRPLVVLLGDSLLMEGLAVSLADWQMLGVIRVDPAVTDIKERLEALKPYAVIFEFDTPRLDSILAILCQQPGILLLGLDLACSRLLVLNSRQHFTPTLKDLCQVIQAETGQQVRSPKGGAMTKPRREQDVP